MTDYLEGAAEEADFLWEESRQRGVPLFAGGEGKREPEAGAEERMPLAGELLRAQRQGAAAAALAELAGGRREPAAPEQGGIRRRRQGTVPAEEGRADGWPARSSGWGQREGQLWVRQVDLAFSRDSRRYDGPFSLY